MVIDTLGRPLRSLRISVTDRCNLRCEYCMPADEYVWLPRSSLLSFEEIQRLAGVFASLGVDKIRITGGEPLLRHDLPRLVGMIRAIPGIRDLAMTTNGVLLARHAAALQQAGLDRVTVSLDTLDADRFARYAKSSRLSDVFSGLEAVRELGFGRTKINSVVVRGVNDDELLNLFEFATSENAEVRYIEYMDVGGATDWSMDQVVSRQDILSVFRDRFDRVEPIRGGDDPSAPAELFRVPDGRIFGVIASTTEPFCRTCDRSRVTADGMYFLCLYADNGVDLREPLRSGATDDELRNVIRKMWIARQDRGAEERQQVSRRGALYQLEGLRSKPHREMHTRGG